MLRIRRDQLEAFGAAMLQDLRARVRARFIELHPEQDDPDAVVTDAIEVARTYGFVGEEALLRLARWSVMPKELWEIAPWGPLVLKALFDSESDANYRLRLVEHELLPRLAAHAPEAAAALRRVGIAPASES